jgi:hypothetical protein
MVVLTRNTLALCLLTSLSSALHADFTYTDTTQITGGSMVGVMKMAGAFSRQARQLTDPITSTVMVKGNRMARINSLQTEIVDLDKETITTIDHAKHQYSVISFQQMKQQMDAAVQKAKERQKTDATQPASDTKVSFQAHVRQTSATKDVSGISTSEAILNMAMNATDKKSGQTGTFAISNDMWLAPEVPGYQEVRDFHLRFAQKLGSVFSDSINPSLLAVQPAAGQAMADMAKEMSKLKGVPVLQVMRMGSTADGSPLPAASEAPLPQANTPVMPSAGQIAKQSATAAVASGLGLGGFGGFGHKKKADPPAAATANQDANKTQGAAVLIETSTQVSGFSQAPVDPAKFEIPAGYKQVERKIAEQ